MEKKPKKNISLGFDIKVKVGLLTTVAKSIYADALMKIREAVSNSKDNSATKFTFTLKKDEKKNQYTLSLFDNGTGITKEKFKDIFQSLGYGLHRNDKDAANFYSYFGLGLMSVLQLGNKVTIITKPKASKEMNKFTINSKAIFSKEMEKEHLDALSKHITPSDAKLADRDLISPFSEQSIKKLFNKMPENFTEIIIEELSEADIQTLSDVNFMDNIRKMLPLPVEESDSFFTGLKKSHKDKIIATLKDKAFCPTIDFYYSADGVTRHRLLKKYFPQFPHPYSGSGYQFYPGSTQDFSYYFLAAGKDRGVKDGAERETGIWSRNKNFLVKASDYLQYQGFPSFVRDPIKGWIYGEVFHKNMNDFLEVSRKEFIVSSIEFKKFRAQIKVIVKKISDEMSEAYDVTLEIVRVIKEPIENIQSITKSPFKQLEKNLANIEGLKIEDIVGDKAAEIEAILNEIRSPELESSPQVVSVLKEKNKPIVIAEETGSEGKNYQVRLDPSAQEQVIKFNHTTNRVEATIPASILEPQLISLFGKEYSVYFKDGRRIDKGISINTEKAEIHVNFFFRDFKKHSVTFLEVLVAAEYALKASRCKEATSRECMDEMKDTILQFLGAEYKNLPEYVDSFAKHL